MSEPRSNAPLKWESFLTSGIPTATPNPPPGEKRRFFSPVSSTLIYGQRDAVLVDTFITVDQNDVLVDWVRASGKNQTTIYITHGHGDHWFGIGALLERFPGAKAVASPSVVKMMNEQSPEALRAQWQKLMPGQITERIVGAEELSGNVIELEGQELFVVEVGHTDTHDTTVLHVPTIGLVVAGDAVYNGVHQLMLETDPQKRREWIAAVDKVESLKPRVVIAGHKRPGSEDSPRILEETRQYIRDFDRLAETTTTGRELYDEMLKLHPLRMNLNTLWTSALASKAQR
jgi:glyoxylase-like metal-dependent hydrolase (beta-lactamase superfamily II)